MQKHCIVFLPGRDWCVLFTGFSFGLAFSPDERPIFASKELGRFFPFSGKEQKVMPVPGPFGKTSIRVLFATENLDLGPKQFVWDSGPEREDTFVVEKSQKLLIIIIVLCFLIMAACGPKIPADMGRYIEEIEKAKMTQQSSAQLKIWAKVFAGDIQFDVALGSGQVARESTDLFREPHVHARDPILMSFGILGSLADKTPKNGLA